MLLKILEVKQKNFVGDEGGEIKYFWYKAERMSDGIIFRFGSSTGTLVPGYVGDLNLEKYERSDGKVGYRYISG